jgi:hypothetical protein
MKKYHFNGLTFTNPTIEVGPIMDVMRGTGLLHINIQVHAGENQFNFFLGSMNYTDTWEDADVDKFVEDNLPLHEVE